MDDVRANLKKTQKIGLAPLLSPGLNFSDFVLHQGLGVRMTIIDENMPLQSYFYTPTPSPEKQVCQHNLIQALLRAVPEDHNMLEVMGKRLSPCWVKTFHE